MYICRRNVSNSIIMTTVELRTTIIAELDQMSVEMLESVSHYVKRLRRSSRPTHRATTSTSNHEAIQTGTTRNTEEFTPRVLRFKRGNPWYATDEDVDRLRNEYLSEKYK